MYCALDDLKGRMSEDKILELADFEGTGDINDLRVQKRISDAINDAASEIDGYCMARYPVPFNPVPAIIKKLAVDLALYNLFSLRGFDEDSPDKVIAERYRAAVKTLENLSRGIVTIGQPEPPDLAADNRPAFAGPERMFTRDKMSGF
ncbi:MAG: DUF1320 domain-containing protein [Peptococcaceae bacterium]|nr:DUF1320 domain-containing protein [Peptococcaceae bacterium]